MPSRAGPLFWAHLLEGFLRFSCRSVQTYSLLGLNRTSSLSSFSSITIGDVPIPLDTKICGMHVAVMCSIATRGRHLSRRWSRSCSKQPKHEKEDEVGAIPQPPQGDHLRRNHAVASDPLSRRFA